MREKYSPSLQYYLSSKFSNPKVKWYNAKIFIYFALCINSAYMC